MGPSVLFRPTAISTGISTRRYALCRYGHSAPKLSNSPFRAPPRKACHSSGVNRSTGPSGSRLLRRPIVQPGRLATSTQLPLEKLRELLTQLGPESGLSGEFPNVGLATITSLIVVSCPQYAQSVRWALPNVVTHFPPESSRHHSGMRRICRLRRTTVQ